MKAIDQETVLKLAAEFAAYRLDGCPTGGGDRLRENVRAAARKLGVSYSELFVPVHAAAYRLIDADPRAQLRKQPQLQPDGRPS
jgi:hypothetical protein